MEKRDKLSPYEQLRKRKGIFYPAPTYEIAKEGGVARKYMAQEKGWKDKPYSAFRRKDGKAKFKLTEQDYSRAKELTDIFAKAGKDPNFFAMDHYDVLVEMRDNGLTPELPDFDYYGKSMAEIKQADKYPFWLNLGVVFEHFHTTKTIRGGHHTTSSAGAVPRNESPRRAPTGDRGRGMGPGRDASGQLRGAGQYRHEEQGQARAQQGHAGAGVLPVEPFRRGQRRPEEEPVARQRGHAPGFRSGIRPGGLQARKSEDREDLDPR